MTGREQKSPTGRQFSVHDAGVGMFQPKQMADFVHEHAEQVHAAGGLRTHGSGKAPASHRGEFACAPRRRVDEPTPAGRGRIQVDGRTVDSGNHCRGQVRDLDGDSHHE